MYFTWSLIIIIFSYAALFFFLPSWTFLGYGLILLFFLWLFDCLYTIRQPRLGVQRRYPVPIYQNGKAGVELVVTNPFPRRLRVYVKDEPPFEAVAGGEKGWLTIPGRREASLFYEITLPKRGIFHFGAVNFRFSGILQLFKQQYKVPAPQDIRVYPTLSKIGDYRFDKLIPSRTEGIHRTRFLGFGGELAKLREFVAGDDLRKVNWKVTAHVGKPFLNEYEPEKDQNVFLFFDTGRALFDQVDERNSRFDRILDSAIILAYNILEHGDLVGGVSFHHLIEHFLPAGKGTRQMQLFVDTFFGLEAVMLESDYRTAFNFWQQHNNKRSLLFFYTDITDYESSKDLIRHLMVFSTRHLVVCVILKKSYLVELTESPIQDEKSAYQKGVALELLTERENMKRMLRNRGIAVLEVDFDNINRTVVEHYLYLKETGRF